VATFLVDFEEIRKQAFVVADTLEFISCLALSFKNNTEA
jgi:hypothetical protein